MRKYFFYSFLILALSFVAFTTSAQNEYAKEIMKTLTAPEMHGRGYVANGDALAADYIAKKYVEADLLKFNSNYFQHFSFPVNTFPDSMRLTVNGKNLIPGYDFIVGPDCPTVNKTFPIVYCKGADAFSIVANDNNKSGKLFVFDAEGITNKDSLKLFQKLIEKTNLVCPVIRLEPTKLTWSVASEYAPHFFAEVLKDKWPADSGQVSIAVNNVLIAKHEAKNVIGYIKGKGKKRKQFIVLTAHYDHLGRMGESTYFPGANDNASGVAQLLSVMNYYKAHPPKYSVVFIAFAGEEAGLLGSRYFTEHPLLELKKIKFLINLDIMGTGEDGITVVNATKHPEQFQLLKSINSEKNYLTEIKSRGEAANSDHYFFSQKGVPTFFIYTLGGSKAYHDVNDQMEGLSFNKFDAITYLLIDFIATF